ncbi:MAG: hypothetical protein K2H72_05270, partial [Muribaculaceae bacterium]|nr:hypothetical protein [Muribaculaceae bacterium]
MKNYLIKTIKDWRDFVKIWCHTIEADGKFRYLLAVMFLVFVTSHSMSSPLHRYQDFVCVGGGHRVPLFGITALTIDDNGFVWGASRMGIFRSTPSHLQKYELPVSTFDVMQMKLAYNKGILAAASQNGQVFRYDRIKDSFELWFSISDALGTKDWISNIVIDNAGIPWVSTSLGIYKYIDNVLQRQEPEMSGYSYILADDGNDMFAIADGGFFGIYDNGKRITKLPGSFKHLVSSAAYDPHRKRIFMGTYKGELWEYRLKEKSLSKVASDEIPEVIIRSILIPDKDIILLGMEGGGIIVLDSQNFKVLEVI